MKLIKNLISVIGGLLSSFFGVVGIPLSILVGFNIIDYLTGISAAKNRGQKIDSAKGLGGIIKKILMWLLVVVAYMVDGLIAYSANRLGINIAFNTTIASITCVWLAVNECISILENIVDAGVEVPSFLESIVKNLKSKMEDKADAKTDNADR